MTKANILRKYFKKFYDLDLTGMSLAEVLKQFMKAQYDFDSKGSGVVSIVQEMIDNDLAPAGGGGSGKSRYAFFEVNQSTGQLPATWNNFNAMSSIATIFIKISINYYVLEKLYINDNGLYCADFKNAVNSADSSIITASASDQNTKLSILWH